MGIIYIFSERPMRKHAKFVRVTLFVLVSSLDSREFQFSRLFS